MKKIFAWMLSILMVFSLAACGTQPSVPQSETNSQSSAVSGEQENSVPASSAAASPSSASSSEEKGDAQNAVPTEGTTPITLTIGDTVLTGYLNDSVPAKSLIAQLPVTVSLSDSDM